MNRMPAIFTVNLVLAGLAWTELAQGQPQASELITKVYEIKWRKAEDLATLLAGFPDIRGNREQRSERRPRANVSIGHRVTGISKAFNTITISAPPTQHHIIQELIHKYDTPPKRALFQFYILGAKLHGEGTTNGLPASIKEVVQDIASLTRYRQFEVLGSPVITVSEGGGNKQSSNSKIKGRFVLEVAGMRVVSAPGKTSVVVDKFRFEATDKKIDKDILLSLSAINKTSAAVSAYSTASLATPFIADSGETLVIGTSHVGDSSELGDAVIVVVTPTVFE